MSRPNFNSNNRQSFSNNNNNKNSYNQSFGSNKSNYSHGQNLNYNHNNNSNYKYNNQSNNYNSKFSNQFNNLRDENSDDEYDVDLNQKSHVIDFLYNKIEINEHKYTIIKNIGDVYDLKNKKFYVSLNSCGINSFIVFTKKDNNYYSFMIDRRSISYNRQSLKKSNVRLTEISLSVDLKIYDGTILDGVLIDSDSSIISSKSDKSKPKMQFMVTDVFMLAGKSLVTMDYKKKMFAVANMFENLVEPKNKTNDIDLYLSRPYELNQIQSLFKDYIQPNIKKYNIKGISFYPQFSSSKIIYVFDKQDEKYKNDLLIGDAVIEVDQENNLQLLDPSDKKRIFKFELMDPECIDDIVLNLEMRKTNISDVYKLYGIFHCISTKNSEEQYIKKKIGIAYIPTYTLSLKCKSYFLNNDIIIMSCIFNTNKKKWVPLDEASIHKIDIINNEKRLKIIEQEIIDNDNEQIDYLEHNDQINEE